MKSPPSAIPVLACGIASVAVPGCVSVPAASPSTYVANRITEDDMSLPFTAARAVQIALRNDPVLRASRWRVSEAYWRKVQTSLPLNPSLTVSADPTQWVARLSVALVSLADAGGARQQLVDAAHSREEQAAVEVARREIEIVQEVRILFAEITAERRIGELLSRKREALGIAAELVRQRREAGAASELDLARAIASERETGLDQQESVARLATIEARFNRALGRRLTAPITLDESGEDLLTMPATQGGTATSLALARRPEIAIVLARAAEHQALMRYAEVAWVPGVQGGLSIGRPGRDEDVVAGAQVAITIPVFDYGQALRKSERASLESLQEDLIAAEAGVILDIHLAAMELSRLTERAKKGIPELLKAAQRSLEIMEGALQEGGASVLDVSAAHVRVLDLEVRLERAMLEHRKAEIALAAAMGDRADGEGSKGAPDHGLD